MKRETLATTGYAEACGACLLPMKVHPVKHCPYLYKAIRHKRQIVGYGLKKKARHGDQA